jgi:hypothetical protein
MPDEAFNNSLPYFVVASSEILTNNQRNTKRNFIEHMLTHGLRIFSVADRINV